MHEREIINPSAQDKFVPIEQRLAAFGEDHFDFESNPNITFIAGNHAANYRDGDPRQRNPTRKILTARNSETPSLAYEVLEARIRHLFQHAPQSPQMHFAGIDDSNPLLGDIVFLSVTARDFGAAEKIANRAIGEGKEVVFGGPLATKAPEMIFKATDEKAAVVAGRAERLLPELFLRMQDKTHRGAIFSDPHYDARYDYVTLSRAGTKTKLLGPNTQGALIEAGVGCSQKCDFCAIPEFSISARNPDHVIGELQRLRDQGVRHIMFADDNLAMRPRRHLQEIFSWMNNHDMYWIGGATRNLVVGLEEKDARVIGRNNLLLLTGLEDGFSIGSQPNQKNRNSEQMKDDINFMLQVGILPYGSIVIGSDKHEYPDVFQYYQKLLLDLQIPSCIHIATPMHGTAWYEQLLNEGRIIDQDPHHYDFGHLVFRPQILLPEQLVHGVRWLQRETADPLSSAPRVIRNVLAHTGNKQKYFDPRTRAMAFLMGLSVDAFWAGTSAPTPNSLNGISSSFINRYWPVSKL